MKKYKFIQAVLPCLIIFLLTVKVMAFGPAAGGGPNNGETSVPVQAMIDRSFDTPLSAGTVNTTNVFLKAHTPNEQGGTPGGSNLCAQVLLSGTTRILCEHTADLTANQWYTFRVTTGVQTSTGVALGANASYVFRTSDFSGGSGFNPPPIIEGSSPRAGSTIPVNAPVRVYIDPQGNTVATTMKTTGDNSVLSATNIQLFAAVQGQPSGDNMLACPSVGGNAAAPTDCNMAWDATNKVLTVTPGKKAPAGTAASAGGSAMTGGSSYILIVKGPTAGAWMGQGGVQNTADVPLMGGDYRVEFRTTAADVTAPDVSGSYPSNNAASVDRAIYDINAGFNEDVDPSTITGGSLRLYCEDNDADGSNGCTAGTDGWDANDTLITGVFVDYDPAGRTAYLSPSALLAASKKHYIRLTTDIKDLAGNRLDGDTSTEGNQAEVIAFTTGTNINGGAADSTKPTILYANADNFSVAATLSEPVKFDPDEIETETTSGLAGMVNNISYWSVESPPGSQVNLSDKDIEYIPRDRTLIIRGLMLSPNQEVRVKAVTATGAAYIQDLSGNVINTASSGSIADVTVQSMQDSGGNLGPGAMTGGFDYFSMGTEPVMVYPRTGMAGVASNYEVEFNLNQSIPLGGTIVLTFPQGFSFVADGGSSECQDAVTSMENGDVNGPAQGTMTIDSVACSSAARTVTVTTAGAATGARDRLRFLIQGIVNSSVPKDYTTSGYSVDIKTKDIQGNMLESKTSMPFFLSQPGTQHIHGYVFNDNGAVGGTANNKTKDGGEPGVASVQVCLGGMGGFTCQNTTATGAFFFNSLSNGFYHIDVPPLSAGSFVGGPFYKDMELIGGNSFDNIGFALRSSDVNINVTINGIPTGTNIDVFAFNPTNFDAGGNIVRAVLWNGSASRTVALPVSDGTWEVGVGPWMQKDRGLGPQQMPTFTFLPPKSQQVLVSGGDGAVTFNLQSANRTVSGTVLDGAGVAIPNAFIMARPAKFTSGIGGGGGAQSQFNGRFSLNLADGVYLIEATIPGMPMSNSAEVTVTADTSNYSVDHNSTADVYANGVLVINDGDSDSDDIVLKIAKGGRSIAGLVLDESGNAISYAHVMAEQVDSSGNPIGRFSDSPTDSSGNFTIYVSDGIWKLRGFAPGYGELPTLTVTVSGTSLTGQNLQASSSDYGTVTGSVLKGGTVQAGAFVGIWGSSGGNSSVTDSNGVFTLKAKAGSNYTIDGFLPGVGKLTPLTGITVTAGQTLGNQNLTISAPGTIQVTVGGVADAFVQAMDSSGRGNQTSTNTTAGVYSLNVPAGTYTVKAHSPAYGQIGSQSSVAVTANATTSLTFTTPTPYRITGTVESASNICKNGAAVFFKDATNGRMIDTQTTSTGGYAILLPNGTYAVSVSKSGCTDSAAPSSIIVSGADLSVSARTLNAATSTISGRVTLSSTGITVPTVIMAQNSQGLYAFDEVDTSASGGGDNYSISVTPGTWTVSARSDGYNSSPASVSAVSGSTASSNFSVSAISGYTRRERKTSTLTPNRGGFVRDENIGDGFEINFPAGVLGSSTDSASIATKETTAIATVTPTTTIIGGRGYEITPKDSNGNKITTLSSSDGSSVAVTMPYSESEVSDAGYAEESLVMMVWSEEKQDWSPLSTTVDTTNNTMTANVTHFSTFGVGGTSAAASSSRSSSASSSPSGSNASGGNRGGGGTGGYSMRGTTYSAIREAAGLTTDEQMKTAVVKEGMKLKVKIGGNDVAFSDVPADAWFAGPVAKVLLAGIASGYKDEKGNLKGLYGPADNITYAQIAKMALESAGYTASEDMKGAPPYNESALNHWSYGYIRTAEDLGLTVYTDGGMNVNYPAKRGAVVQTVLEALRIPIKSRQELEKVKNEETGAVTLETIDRYSDLPPNNQYSDAIYTATKLGIITGDTDKDGNRLMTVRPNESVNRAEVAKIFGELMGKGLIK